MRHLIGTGLIVVLAGCGGGGTGGSPIPAPTQTPITGQAVPARNGQAFTLSPCVPVYDNPGGGNQVGSACAGTAPDASASPSSPPSAYIINSRTDIYCVPDTAAAGAVLIGFFCNGDPWAPQATPTP